MVAAADLPPVRLRSQQIVTPSGVIAGEVTVVGKRIAAVCAQPKRDRGEYVDLGALWLAPGFIDTHVHGGAGAQCNTADPDEVDAVAAFHAQHGTTALLATTVAAPLGELETSLAAISRSGATVLGAHLEGPFLSSRRPGAMDPAAFIDPEPAAIARLLRAGGGTLRMMTLAPELPGAPELVAALARADAIASLGHTEATYEQAEAAVAAGARSATHLFNAMGPLHHREPGIVGAALDLPQLSCELICDGVHVDPPALRLAHRAKGTDGMRLVTDAIQAAGMADGRYLLGLAAVDVSGGVARVHGGQSLAGSTLTMDAAVRNAVEFLDVPVPEAVAMGSLNPARLLGIADRKGAIAAGADADLVVLDGELRCRATMVAGEWIAGSPEGG
jgi:N-acetylglucosamine-6-phosphate deacetylase